MAESANVNGGKTPENVLWRAIESARNGIILTDPSRTDNPIIFANQAFIDMSGYRSDQILGRNCRFLQRDDRDQPAIERIRDAIRQMVPITITLRNYRRNGSLFWNELTISPVFGADGSLTNFVGVQNDVTARVELERRVSEFYSMISHELRTPLSSIHGALTAMLEMKTNSSVRKLLDIAINNSNRLDTLIDDILDWKKLESGKFKLVLDTVHPAELVQGVIDDFEASAHGAGVSLRKNVFAEKPIRADGERLAQVLSNLVSNAIKHSSQGSEVMIKAVASEFDTKFSVTDSGAGIAESQIDCLFMKFQQLDSSDRRPKGGTGLGLAIAKSLVELHGGRIGVESTPGTGSTFWFEIDHNSVYRDQFQSSM